MKHNHVHNSGFTLVELLIVIVVIAILATITLVAYNSVVSRANDAAVESDLHNLASTLEVNGVDSGTYPSTATNTEQDIENGLSTEGLKVTKAAYGHPIIDTSSGSPKAYNLLYCSTNTGYSPAEFAFIGSSTSGNVFSILSGGAVSSFPVSNWTGGWGTICPAILGVTAGNSGPGVWLYENSIWKSWLSN